MKHLLPRSFENRYVLGLFVFVAAGIFYFLPAHTAQAAVPFGYVDGVSQAGVVSGWAIDPDIAGAHIEVHAYFDGPAGKSKTVVGSSTNLPRCDVRYYQDINDCGFGYGYNIAVPASLQDGKEHKVYVYAIDARSAQGSESGWPKTGASALLKGSPMSFRIGMSNAPRHARGALIQHNGTVYFVGEQMLYPFPSVDVFLSWGVSFSQVVPANSGDLALATGPVVKYKTQTVLQPDSANRLPVGRVDEVNVEGKLRGWVFDPDAPNSSLTYYVYIDGQLGSSATNIMGTANFSRPDVNSVYSVSGNHGFEVNVSTLPGVSPNFSHQAYVYAVDPNDGSVFLVNGSPYLFYVLSIPVTENSVAARDAQRLAQIRQIQTALEIYYNDMGSYPLDSGFLDGLGLDSSGWTANPSGSTQYLKVVAPPPPADGNCSSLANDYYYVGTRNYPVYQVYFCLGGNIQGYAAGNKVATPSGIVTPSSF